MGQWLRKQTLILAQNNHTSASFWLSVRLVDLRLWIAANNEIIEERERK